MTDIKRREWEAEDLNHLDDIIGLGKSDGATALPGMESVRDQVAIRLGKDTRYENHDMPRDAVRTRHTS